MFSITRFLCTLFSCLTSFCFMDFTVCRRPWKQWKCCKHDNQDAPDCCKDSHIRRQNTNFQKNVSIFCRFQFDGNSFQSKNICGQEAFKTRNRVTKFTCLQGGKPNKIELSLFPYCHLEVQDHIVDPNLHRWPFYVFILCWLISLESRFGALSFHQCGQGLISRVGVICELNL